MHDGAQSHSALGAAGTSLPCFRTGSGPVLELREIAHQRIMELARPRAGATLDAFLSAFGVEGLARIGASVTVGGSSLLGIGPGLWLLIALDETPQTSGAKLAAAFDVAVETGDAWTQLVISGSASLDLLAKGCALDLHRGAFQKGACAVTRFAQVRCVLHRAGDVYRLLIGRSYAVSLAEWLIEAAAEFGLGMKVHAEGAIE
jgi:sarcosine oxidase subunit gamma